MRVPLAVLGALILGILLGDRLGPASAGDVLAVAAALAVLAVLAGRGSLRWVVIPLVVIAVGLVGCGLERRARHGLIVSPLSAAIQDGAAGRFVLTLAEDPSGAFYTVDALARVSSFDGRKVDRTVALVGSGDASSELRVLAAGDRVLVEGRLRALSGYHSRSQWRHAVAELHIEEIDAAAPPLAPWWVLANRLRATVEDGLNVLPAAPRALLAGFLLGDTRDLPPDLVDDFRNAGMSHLLAVSGANVAFVLAMAAPLLRRMSLRGRLVGGLAVIGTFATMTRWEPSVMRASVMAGLVLLARFLGRPADAARVLVYAMVMLLLVDPFLLRSVGFLLSCGACAGIVLLSAPLAARLPGPRLMRETLGVTLGAQVGVAPLLLAVFGSVPLISIPANMIAVPLAAPLTVWGLAASVGGGIFGPGLGRWLQMPNVALLGAVEAVARLAGQVPLSVDARQAGAVVAAGGLVLAAPRMRRRVTGRVGGRGRRVSREGFGSGPA